MLGRVSRSSLYRVLEDAQTHIHSRVSTSLRQSKQTIRSHRLVCLSIQATKGRPSALVSWTVVVSGQHCGVVFGAAELVKREQHVYGSFGGKGWLRVNHCISRRPMGGSQCRSSDLLTFHRLRERDRQSQTLRWCVLG